MKTLLIGLLAFGSVSAFSAEKTFSFKVTNYYHSDVVKYVDHLSDKLVNLNLIKSPIKVITYDPHFIKADMYTISYEVSEGKFCDDSYYKVVKLTGYSSDSKLSVIVPELQKELGFKILAQDSFNSNYTIGVPKLCE